MNKGELKDLVESLRPGGGRPDGPLSGVVVLDITRVVAGPYCSMILADLGASVIKIENPADPDYARTFPPVLDNDAGGSMSGFFAQFNRNKAGLTLNLKAESGARILKELVAGADVLVENFRAGAMERFGLGYDVLSQINPRLVYAALSGFGQTGPYRNKPAYDNSGQATGGLWSINGPVGEPTRVGTIIGDLSASLYGTIGVLAALRHAEQAGEGQMVDISQQDAVLTLTENAVVNYTGAGVIPQPLGDAHPFVRPYESFPCKDGRVFFGGYTDKFWKISCELFGRPGDYDNNPDLQSMAQRFDADTYERQVKPMVLRWFKDRTKAELEELAGDKVPLSAVKNIAEVISDPQISEREMIVASQYEGFGELRTFGSPVKLSRTPAQVVGNAPQPGADTEALIGALGYNADDLAALRVEGAI